MQLSSTKLIRAKPQYVLVYGVSGIGKTSLAKSLPNNQTIILDAESGLTVLDGTDIDVFSLAADEHGALVPEEERLGRLIEFQNFLRTPEARAKYKYVFIDSLTEIAQNIQRHMKSQYEGFKMWGEYADAMVDLIKFFRDLGCYNTVFTALEDFVEDKDDPNKPAMYMPNVVGRKAKDILLPCFDLVMRYVGVPSSDNTRIESRVLVCNPTPKSQAKDRSGKLAATEEPNLMRVLTKIKGDA